MGRSSYVVKQRYENALEKVMKGRWKHGNKGKEKLARERLKEEINLQK